MLLLIVCKLGHSLSLRKQGLMAMLEKNKGRIILEKLISIVLMETYFKMAKNVHRKQNYQNSEPMQELST